MVNSQGPPCTNPSCRNYLPYATILCGICEYDKEHEKEGYEK